ncbi:hypothetical protein [Virgibacillus litoralis]|uniref:Cytochrome bd-type quinol oxidase subunit 2 n=1 Tax=Virgibacillus litoralis TaxID=578221 RepID=A0ABS4HCN9_9BACI|nr:hypothetical protein [Virgibacillus litoralis]MBP1948682.1 cytochrome bd-type quinol oxidase subunit 2 [Virgibacillus litoralis]
MNRVVLIAIVLIIYMVYITIKHKETMKKLSFPQQLGVAISFLGVVGIGCYILFNSVRYFDAAVSNDIFSMIIQFIIALVVLVVSVLTFSAIAYKITNGILPIQRKRK